MYHRLSTKWQYIRGLYESGNVDTDPDTQEIIEDMLNRNLTKDFIDLLKVVLVDAAVTCNDASSSDFMDQDNGGMAVDTPSRGNNVVAEVVSELGSFVLRNPATCDSVVTCVLGYEYDF